MPLKVQAALMAVTWFGLSRSAYAAAAKSRPEGAVDVAPVGRRSLGGLLAAAQGGEGIAEAHPGRGDHRTLSAWLLEATI